MGLNKRKKMLDDILQIAYNALYEKGFIEGFDRGYDAGFADGQKSEIENHNAAVSDGLRAGSSECGKQMNRRKK